MKAIVEKFDDVYGIRLEDGTFSHTVLCIDESDESDVIDLVDFKNEFAARTYADAVNMGLAV